jgi:16S rRNA (uracil1498-N3)-methyltransferase
VRAPLSGLTPGVRELEEETDRYLLRVRRLAPGDSFLAFDPEAELEADAKLCPPAGRRARAILGPPRPASLRPDRRVTLVQALGKGDKVEAVVRDATELGVSGFVPVLAERSVRRPNRADVQLDRWRRIAVQAARQCGRGDVPTIAPLAELPAALERLGRPAPPGLGVCLHPEGDESLGSVLRAQGAPGEVTVLVGPEGGFAPAELELARGLGYRIVTLGALVLRTETACAAVLGALLCTLPVLPASR